MAAAPTFSIDEMKTRMQKSVASLRDELTGLRTGRASASLLEPVMVEAYGTRMPLNQIATVTVPEARLLSVQVWDRSMAPAVDKAIRNSGLGLNPSTEGATIRVPLPELNEERRRELTKVAHNYAEQARVAIRHIRRDGMELLKKLEKDGQMSQDDGRAEIRSRPEGNRCLYRRSRYRCWPLRNRKSCRFSLRTTTSARRAAFMSSEPAIQPRAAAAPALRIPAHIGVIMDGNGRWARARGKPRTEGHVAGVKALRQLVESCINQGVAYLTVFSFSSENWTRPKDEISFIFGLLRRFVASDLEQLHGNNVRVRIIGSREGLDDEPSPADRRGRDDDRNEHRPQAAGRLQLRRQGRNRPGRPPDRRASCSRTA